MKVSDIKAGDDVYVIHREKLTKVRACSSRDSRDGVLCYYPPGRQWESHAFVDDLVWAAEELPAVREQRAANAKLRAKAEEARKARVASATSVAARLGGIGVVGAFSEAPSVDFGACVCVRLTLEQARTLLTALGTTP